MCKDLEAGSRNVEKAWKDFEAASSNVDWELLELRARHNDFGEAMSDAGFAINIHENKNSVTYIVEGQPQYPILYSKKSPGNMFVYQVFEKKDGKVIPFLFLRAAKLRFL